MLALDVVLADGSVARLGGLEPDAPGFDLRGCFVGSEGTMGIATRIAVRLKPNPPCVRTLLLDFTSIDDAAATVERDHRGGHRPRGARDDGRRHHAGRRGLRRRRLPARRRCGAARRDRRAARRASRPRSPSSTASAGSTARGTSGSPPTPPSARCSGRAASRRSARSPAIKPDYYLHDAVVPRTQAASRCSARSTTIAAEHDLIVVNVFHAGDGNLHPILVFDAREPGIWERVHAAGDAIVRARASTPGEC